MKIPKYVSHHCLLDLVLGIGSHRDVDVMAIGEYCSGGDPIRDKDGIKYIGDVCQHGHPAGYGACHIAFYTVKGNRNDFLEGYKVQVADAIDKAEKHSLIPIWEAESYSRGYKEEESK